MIEADEKELLTLREFAAGRCAIQKVIDALGPMSLWSKDAFKREIAKAVAAEREACAKLAREFVWYEAENCSPDEGNVFIARAIEARGNAL